MVSQTNHDEKSKGMQDNRKHRFVMVSLTNHDRIYGVLKFLPAERICSKSMSLPFSVILACPK